MTVNRQQETPAGYLARAKAVHKINQTNPPRCRQSCCAWASLGEFLHAADIEGI